VIIFLINLINSINLINFNLPARFGNAGHFAFIGQFPKANPAEVEFADISSTSAATPTAPNNPGRIFGFAFSSGDL